MFASRAQHQVRQRYCATLELLRHELTFVDSKLGERLGSVSVHRLANDSMATGARQSEV